MSAPATSTAATMSPIRSGVLELPPLEEPLATPATPLIGWPSAAAILATAAMAAWASAALVLPLGSAQGLMAACGLGAHALDPVAGGHDDEERLGVPGS